MPTVSAAPTISRGSFLELAGGITRAWIGVGDVNLSSRMPCMSRGCKWNASLANCENFDVICCPALPCRKVKLLSHLHFITATTLHLLFNFGDFVQCLHMSNTPRRVTRDKNDNASREERSERSGPRPKSHSVPSLISCLPSVGIAAPSRSVANGGAGVAGGTSDLLGKSESVIYIFVINATDAVDSTAEAAEGEGESNLGGGGGISSRGPAPTSGFGTTTGGGAAAIGGAAADAGASPPSATSSSSRRPSSGTGNLSTAAMPDSWASSACGKARERKAAT